MGLSRLTPALVLLSKAGDKTSAIAKAWAATPELKADGFTQATTKKLLDGLVALASAAQKSKTDVLLYISL